MSSLGPGTQLLHYRLISRLGEGGMGEVWRATDTSLDREVAIKFLPAAFANDPERLARFEREAKLLASLNHPNIAAVYGLHDAGGVRFLAMELVPGEDLSKRLLRGPMDTGEVLEMARQIAAALDAAHASGVVHRDLKPANIQRAPDGTVKVLDFGLAKALEPTGGDLRQSMTVTSAGSTVGVLLGTAAYMSPEQARAQAVDRRTDIWAFGCVLYEMLSGKKAFDGPTITDVLAAVVSREPDWDALPADTPTHARRLLRRCLEKDVRKRLRDAGDASLLLEENLEDARLAVTSPAPANAKRRSMWIALLPWIAVVALIVAYAMKPGTEVPSAASIVLSAKLPPGVRLLVDGNEYEAPILAISRDGSKVAYVARDGAGQRLYLRPLDTLEATPIRGTKDAVAPFFSPDGKWVGFFAGGRLRKVPVDGGDPIDLAEATFPRGAVWCDDDNIIFSGLSTSGLSRVASGGGDATPLTTLDAATHERTHRWPALLPGGEVAYTVGVMEKPGSYEDSRIDAIDPNTGKVRTLFTGASVVRATADGYLVLGRGSQILAIRLDATEGGAPANATPILQGIAGMPSSGSLYFDVAENGTLVFVERDPASKDLELVRVSRNGNVEALPFPSREYRRPRLSPDEKKIAVEIGPGWGRAGDIWVGDIARGELTRLTFASDGAVSQSPIWTPDGKEVVFSKTHPGYDDQFAAKAADGTSQDRILKSFPGSTARAPSFFTPDGQRLVFIEEGGPGHGADILSMSLPDGATTPLVATPAMEITASLSPDGRFLAYVSNESGQSEVFVQPADGSGGRWQVSDGGDAPVWSKDGKSLFFKHASYELLEVPVIAGTPVSFGKPQHILATLFTANLDTAANYDVDREGRFLMVRPKSEPRTQEHFNVVLNFSETLKAALK